ncbi:11311_t:CDS:1 [Entrophospora sp. SA101]|nr:11311_t:CDS:1 [Entrophospora sp. SA101]
MTSFPFTVNQQNDAQKKLVEFMINNVQPFSLVTSETFKRFVASLNSNFTIPTIYTVKEMISAASNNLNNKLKQKLSDSCEFCCLTTDFWTSRDNKGYIGITCTWLENFELVEVLLNLSYAPYPHTGLKIKELLMNEIIKWDLEKKVIGIATDNGSNMVNSIKLLNESLDIERIAYAVHTLQLSVKKALEINDQIKILVIRVRRLILFFKLPKQCERLENIQKKLNYTQILKPVKTRWNSTYMAWNCLIYLKNAILDLIKDMEIDNDRDVKYDFKRLKKILLSDDEWSLIEIAIYVTLSLVYPIMSHLINKIKLQLHNDSEVEIFDEFVPPLNTEEIILDCSSEIEDNNTEEAAEEMDEIFMQADENDGEIEILEEKKSGERLKKKLKISKPISILGLKNKILNALYSSLINYWSVTPQIGLLASALDPRFKSLTFALHRYDATYKVLSEKNLNLDLRRSAVVIQTNPSKNTIFDELLNITTQQISYDELTRYSSIANVAGNIDPLAWWKERKNDLPTLAVLANKYLCLSATSVPSERLFSDVGNHITNKRNRLSSKTISELLFLKRNMKTFSIFD